MIEAMLVNLQVCCLSQYYNLHSFVQFSSNIHYIMRPLHGQSFSFQNLFGEYKFEGNNNRLTVLDSEVIMRIYGSNNHLQFIRSSISLELVGSNNHANCNQTEIQTHIQGNYNQISLCSQSINTGFQSQGIRNTIKNCVNHQKQRTSKLNQPQNSKHLHKNIEKLSDQSFFDRQSNSYQTMRQSAHQPAKYKRGNWSPQQEQLQNLSQSQNKLKRGNWDPKNQCQIKVQNKPFRQGAKTDRASCNSFDKESNQFSDKMSISHFLRGNDSKQGNKSPEVKQQYKQNDQLKSANLNQNQKEKEKQNNSFNSTKAYRNYDKKQNEKQPIFGFNYSQKRQGKISIETQKNFENKIPNNSTYNYKKIYNPNDYSTKSTVYKFNQNEGQIKNNSQSDVNFTQRNINGPSLNDSANKNKSFNCAKTGYSQEQTNEQDHSIRNIWQSNNAVNSSSKLFKTKPTKNILQKCKPMNIPPMNNSLLNPEERRLSTNSTNSSFGQSSQFSQSSQYSFLQNWSNSFGNQFDSAHNQPSSIFNQTRLRNPYNQAQIDSKATKFENIFNKNPSILPSKTSSYNESSNDNAIFNRNSTRQSVHDNDNRLRNSANHREQSERVNQRNGQQGQDTATFGFRANQLRYDEDVLSISDEEEEQLPVQVPERNYGSLYIFNNTTNIFHGSRYHFQNGMNIFSNQNNSRNSLSANNIFNGGGGLSNQDLQKLPKSLNKHSCELNCLICMEEIGRQEVTFLFCFHFYHSSCIQTWLKQKPNCPSCQHNVREGIRKDEFIKQQTPKGDCRGGKNSFNIFK